VKSINILTLFPEFFDTPLQCGLIGKFIDNGNVTVNIVDIRNFSHDKFHRCDDYPFGGGSGMVLKIEPLEMALKSVEDPGTVILTTPSGVQLNQTRVKQFAVLETITVICGRYEGVDQRFIDEHVNLELSIGDYVLSGGEYAALVIFDSVLRYQPGFMSNPESLSEESFEDNLLEYPHYTRPAEYNGKKVPDVLLSGNHDEIKKWRYEKRLEKTRRVRPDLIN
jgi:tRNA (guanine37-N1)-methyltransferase